MNQKISQACWSEKNEDIFQVKHLFYTKPLLFVFFVVLCLMSAITGNAAADDNLALSNDGKSVILKNQHLQLITTGFSLKITTKDGTLYRIGNNLHAKVNSIVELVNTEKEKYIELKSKKFSYGKYKCEFLTRLKLCAGSPVLEIESELKNLGDNYFTGYYFWEIYPVYSDIYFSKGRFLVDAPGHLNVEDWGYFPASKNNTGFGIAGNTGKSGFCLKTIYPRKNWRKMGWYICKRNMKLIKDKSSSINFIFVPARSLEEFQGVYQNISDKKDTK